MARLRAGIGAVALLVTSLLLLRPLPVSHGSATPPSIVLILTDDQRWDTLWAMPNVQSELVAYGAEFSNAFVVNSLCCPSRVSILTGQYSHTSRVYGNSGAYGGFDSFHGDDSTIATWLSDGGYRTGLIGKYLNGYDIGYVPPGWSYWAAFLNVPAGGAYYDYDLDVNGVVVHYDDAPEDYSTDVLAGYADSFIRSTGEEQPLFLYLSLKAPHTPSTPAPEYMNEFEELEAYRPPNYNEEDVSDKPAWVRALPLLSQEEQDRIDKSRKNQYRTLLSVDDAVDTVITALTETGRLSNALVVFTSDNGWALGEHRWDNKKDAYEESIRVPLVVRYGPNTPTPRTDDHLVANVDLAPTFAEAAGVIAPGVEGTSLLPLVLGESVTWREDFLIERRGDSRGHRRTAQSGAADSSMSTMQRWRRSSMTSVWTSTN